MLTATYSINIVVLMLGAIIGALISFLRAQRPLTESQTARASLQAQLEAVQDELSRVPEQVEATRKETAELKEAEIHRLLHEKETDFAARLADRDRHAEEQRSLILETREQFEQTFDSLSVKTLTTVCDQFLKTASVTFDASQAQSRGELARRQQAIEELLKPFTQTMKALDDRCQKMDEKNAAGDAVLSEHLSRVLSAADSLSAAFRRPTSRGSWGELTMKNVFEQAGLQEGHDYVLQHTTDAEDGRLRADAVVNLPKGRKVVIDAKNLWDGFRQAMEASDAESREALLQKHAQAVRAQVKLLSSKAYWQQYDGPECVVMFLPTEAMYQAALEYDEGLLADAVASRVYLASPITLVGFLNAVGFALDQERLNDNAMAISVLGKKLYEALCSYGTHFAKVGTNLRKTVDAYNASVGSLDRNVLSKARQLSSKGITVASAIETPETVAALPASCHSPELQPGEVAGVAA